MQQLGRMAASEQGLFDLLGRLFNGEGVGAGVLQYANPIIENKDLYKPQPQPNPHAKGFGRPYVMSLQEYVDNYLPHYGLDY